MKKQKKAKMEKQVVSLIEETANSTETESASFRILFLTIPLCAIPAFSTDTYLPAIPDICQHFGTSVTNANLTIVLFTAILSISTLFWGPLSDKYGRKPILLVGLAIYCISSAFCAFSVTINQLILFRVVQAIGGGASSVVSFAILKDVFRSRQREKAIAILGVVMTLAPILAPSIGSQILLFSSWRGIFVFLTILGGMAWFACLVMKETNTVRQARTVVQSLGRLYIVAKNMRLFKLLIVFSVMSWPLFMFIGAAPAILMMHYGVSQQTFSMFFAINALCLGVGPMLYLHLSRFALRKNIVAACFILVSLSGILIVLFGSFGPIPFLLSSMVATMGMSVSRTPGLNMMMEQQKHDAGVVSSLMTCGFGLFGSVGMMIASMDWGNRIQAVGIVYLILGIFCLAVWFIKVSKTVESTQTT